MTASLPSPEAAGVLSHTAPGSHGPDAPSGGPPLVVEHEALRRGRHVALTAGRLELPRGACMGLVGRNGAGKSTLLLAVAGLLRHAPARLTSGGVRSHPSIALVPQHPALPAPLQVRRWLAAQGMDAERLESTIPGVALDELCARRTERLSGGERQLLAVAVALARTDPLMLLDEPFAHLDIPVRRAVRAAVAARRARQPDGIVVISSHVAADLHALCDRLVVVRRGGYGWCGAVAALPGADGTPATFEAAVADQL